MQMFLGERRFGNHSGSCDVILHCKTTSVMCVLNLKEWLRTEVKGQVRSAEMAQWAKCYPAG